MVTKRKLMEEIRDLERRTLVLEGRLEEIGRIALQKAQKAEEPRKEERKKERKKETQAAQSEKKAQAWAWAMGDFKASHPFRPNQDKEG